MLSAIKGKDYCSFWNIVVNGDSDMHAPLDSNISVAAWVEHFSQLYSGDDIQELCQETQLGSSKSTGDVKVEYPIEPATQWVHHISSTRIYKALDWIIPNKAPWMDKVPGDLFISSDIYGAPTFPCFLTLY